VEQRLACRDGDRREADEVRHGGKAREPPERRDIHNPERLVLDGLRAPAVKLPPGKPQQHPRRACGLAEARACVKACSLPLPLERVCNPRDQVRAGSGCCEHEARPRAPRARARRARQTGASAAAVGSAIRSACTQARERHLPPTAATKNTAGKPNKNRFRAARPDARHARLLEGAGNLVGCVAADFLRSEVVA